MAVKCRNTKHGIIFLKILLLLNEENWLYLLHIFGTKAH